MGVAGLNPAWITSLVEQSIDIQWIVYFMYGYIDGKLTAARGFGVPFVADFTEKQ